ncbi:MAG: phosphoglycerate dehydrogenase [Deltaproteobacteria bacterium]|nr:phosphoglycerate dehydrogenase [Deltaproteobacteria bacterium]
MYKILTLNPISVKGLERFSRDRYEVASEIGHPDAILVRSAKVTETHLTPTLKAIARAGAGTDNIPIPLCNDRGIPVFNAPGANANAVKELVLAGMLSASRNILEGVAYVRDLGAKKHSPEELHKLVEGGKKKFAGLELRGKTLGVAGLGAIGSLVAEMGLSMGMHVLGYDPAISVDAAWRLSSEVQRMDNLASLLAKSDFVSLHLPLIPQTKMLINEESLGWVKKGAVLVNFSRDEVVDNQAAAKALDSGRLSRFVTDFPHASLMGRPDVMATPHLGASTEEAEENCALMAANQLIDFLENGNIVNSVNFPRLVLERSSQYRIAVVNRNVAKMLGKVTNVLADFNLNVVDMLNKSRDDIAYNLIDVESAPPLEVIAAMEQVEGVICARLL